MVKDQISKVVIIGAGVMGPGIALNLAYFDYKVTLIDVVERALQRAKDSVLSDQRMIRLLVPALKDIAEVRVLDCISYSTDLNDSVDADLVIETISEDLEKKEALYRELNRVTSKDTIYATNTSCIPVTSIGAWVENPARVIGTHFMNPVLLKDTVEVIPGFYTSQDAIAKVKLFLKSLQKHAIVVQDSPGFVANRLSHLFMNEAAFLVQENVAQAKDIDMIFKKGYGHAMGPLETADLIGIDTVVNSLRVLYDCFQDTKFRCCPLLVKMVHAGKLGKKSGEGFFKYHS